MNDPAVTPELLETLIQMSQARYMVALLILWGMVCVLAATIAFALGWRKVGFLGLIAYGLLMAFLGVGFSDFFGAAVALVACAGLVREYLWGRAAVRRSAPAEVSRATGKA